MNGNDNKCPECNMFNMAIGGLVFVSGFLAMMGAALLTHSFLMTCIGFAVWTVSLGLAMTLLPWFNYGDEKNDDN